jgi:hypothetical protein
MSDGTKSKVQRATSALEVHEVLTNAALAIRSDAIRAHVLDTLSRAYRVSAGEAHTYRDAVQTIVRGLAAGPVRARVAKWFNVRGIFTY